MNYVSGGSLFCTVGLTVTQVAGLDRDHQSEMRSEQLRHVSISAADSTERRRTEEEQISEGLTPEINLEEKRLEEKITAGFTGNIGEILNRNRGYETGRLTPETFSKILGDETEREEYSVADMVKDLDKDVVEMREGRPNVETNEESKTVKGILTDNTKTPETIKTVNSHNTWIQEKRKDDETLEKFKKSDQMDKLKQEIEEEERGSRLVAGISLHKETRGDTHEYREKMLTVNHGNVEEKRGNEERGKRAEEGENVKNANHNELLEREKEDHIVLSDLTPPLSTSSAQLEKELEIPATIEILTLPQNLPSSPHPVHYHNVSPSLLVTPTQVLPVFSHPPIPTTINNIAVSTVLPGKGRSVLLLEDLLPEVLQSPGHHLKQSELKIKASTNVEDIMTKNTLFKPARKELQTTREINSIVQPKEAEFTPKVQAATPKPNHKTKDLKAKGPNPTPISNENNSTAKLVEFSRKPNMTQPTGQPKTVKLTENDTKLTMRRNKASPLQPQLTKPSAKPLLTAKTPSVRSTKVNRSSKSKTIKRSKEKKRKKDNKTQKSSKKKEVVTPTHFPYFLDNYCPPECACYGR